MIKSWVVGEFAGAALGNERLNQRLAKLVSLFTEKPTESIPGVHTD